RRNASAAEAPRRRQHRRRGRDLRRRGSRRQQVARPAGRYLGLRRGARPSAAADDPVAARTRAHAGAARILRRRAHRPHRRPRADPRGRLRRARHRGGRMRYPRLVWSGLVFRVKEFMVSRWFLLISVLQPIIFATIAFYMFKAGRQPGTLLYVALGAGMMGIWSSTLFGSG